MRILAAAPAAFVDPTTGAPAFGSFSGALPRVDLASGRVDRVLRRKKWLYLALASDEVWLSMAIVRMGYATNAFAFVFDRTARRMLVDRTVIGPPRAAEIAPDVHASGVVGRFDVRKTSIAFERRSSTVGASDRPHARLSELRVRARLEDLELDAHLDESAPAIAAIARVGPTLPSATEKRALMKVRGTLACAGKRFALDGAFGGYDYTHGLMPRHTRWRWAFGMGRAKDGAPIGFNVVEGFVGEAECAAFRDCRRPDSEAPDDGVHPLAEPVFHFDREHPERPWRLEGKGIDLTFDVGAVHAQRTNLFVVRSRFLQPAGTFRGTIRVGDRDVELDGVPGVVEDQDVLW